MATAAEPVAGDTPSGVQVARGALIVGSLGIVFGDIGTSPLYTHRRESSRSRPRWLETRMYPRAL